MFILTFSLIGCGSTESSQNKIKSDTEIDQTTVEEEVNLGQEKIEKQANKKDQTSTIHKETPEVVGTEKDSTSNKQETMDSTTKVIQKEGQNNTIKESKTENTSVKTGSSVATNKQSTQIKSNETNTKVSSEAPKQSVVIPTVSISITGSQDIGVILPSMKVNINEDDTVLNVLLKVAKKKNFFVEYSGSGAMTYIEGIDNLYEFDYGPKSGWNFKLNGTTISKSSGIVKVKKDDQIEWIYSEDFTEENE